MANPYAFFTVNLIQDVNIIWPVAQIARINAKLEVGFLVSRRFIMQDTDGRWMQELQELATLCNAHIYAFDTTFEAVGVLAGKNGIVVAASESTLPPHAQTHDLFRALPQGFISLTMQHGFEGVGFLHSREHDKAHGRGVGFAADILCSWFGAEHQKSMLPSQRPKLWVTGPGAVMSRPKRSKKSTKGIICENLHSVRFTENAGSTADFVETFGDFCAATATKKRKVVLRPHPAGQYAIRNALKIPENAAINNNPMYKVDLRQFAYGISAASSVVFDMVLAGIPVAVWRDSTGAMDASIYEGLATVHSTSDWVDFAQAAIDDPEPFLERQAAFMEKFNLTNNRETVTQRFVDIFQKAAQATTAPPVGPRARQAVLTIDLPGRQGVANILQQIPASLLAENDISLHTVSVETARKAYGARLKPDVLVAWLNTHIAIAGASAVITPEPATDAATFTAVVRAAHDHQAQVVIGLETAVDNRDLLSDIDQLCEASIVCGPVARLEPVTHKLVSEGVNVCSFTRAIDPTGTVLRHITSLGTADSNGPINLMKALTTPFEPRKRVLMIAPGFLPTLQLSFVKPFETVNGRRRVTYEIITQEEIGVYMRHDRSNIPVQDWITDRIRSFAPDIMVFCRYGGPYEDLFLEYADQEDIPTIYHIDDDLLNVPASIGEKKAMIHNAPERLFALEHLLQSCDLVYCSTQKLQQQLKTLGIRTPVRAGEIYCPGHIIAPAELRPVQRIGYMASADHAQNLEMMLPAIIEILRRHPTLEFELFGSIPTPPELAQFHERVTRSPPVTNYGRFLEEFAKREWDIGICPLRPIHFNMMKANTKWVEYTSIGAAVVASADTVYNGCVSNGCGFLAKDIAEWLVAFEMLLDPELRYARVKTAQYKLRQDYTINRLLEQVIDVFDDATQRHKATAEI